LAAISPFFADVETATAPVAWSMCARQYWVFYKTTTWETGDASSGEKGSFGSLRVWRWFGLKG
jgi:hypothetical protein